MLSQEDIYKLLYEEKWETLLEILHQQKKTIASDSLLSAAAMAIEREFFRKLKSYSHDREDIVIALETFSQLDAGKFYKLEQINSDLILEELKTRKPDQYDRPIVTAEDLHNDQYNALNKGKLDNVLPDKWLEIYNRLFELVDVRGDAATYFSGPRFINLIRQFLPYFADYQQYISERNRYGKSTTRRIYYFDILKDLDPVVRNQVITEILNIIRPYDEHRVENIELLLFDKHSKRKEPIKVQPGRKPIVFISYSWDDEGHKNWVVQLANRLMKDDVDVKLDRYLLRTGSAMQYTMEQAISKADKILIVFTPNYKLKADNRKGGVGYEYSIMNVGLYLNQTNNDKIIPILRKGSIEESIPSFMQQYVHLDIRNDDNFENSYNDLKRDIFNEPSAFV